MSSLITLLCIFGLSIFMYAYISMYNLKDTNCNLKIYKSNNTKRILNKKDDINNNLSGLLELDRLLSKNSNML